MSIGDSNARTDTSYQVVDDSPPQSDFFVDTTSSTPNSDVASKVRPCGAMLPAIDEKTEIHPEMTTEDIHL